MTYYQEILNIKNISCNNKVYSGTQSAEICRITKCVNLIGISIDY